MVEKRFLVPGDVDLAEIQRRVDDQEKRSSEFLDSNIAYRKEDIWNVVKFKLYDDLSMPKDLVLQEKDAPPPVGKTKVWEGIMAVKGELKKIAAYR